MAMTAEARQRQRERRARKRAERAAKKQAAEQAEVNTIGKALKSNARKPRVDTATQALRERAVAWARETYPEGGDYTARLYEDRVYVEIWEKPNQGGGASIVFAPASVYTGDEEG